MDRPPFWQTWWAYCLYGLAGISLLYGLIHYSVTRERLKSNLKLQTMEAEKMHEIDQMKSLFFANISHEFRTPLTLILGPLENFISRSSVVSQDKAIYQMMHRNPQRLLHLINQLLDLSKLEASSMKLEAKPADIVAFLKAIVLSFTSLAERQQIHFTTHFPATHPIAAFDADKLEKIITNLLSNAFKFTPNGGSIEVLVTLQEMQQERHPQKQVLEIKITDSGIDISEKQKEKIYDRFYQVNSFPYDAQQDMYICSQGKILENKGIKAQKSYFNYFYRSSSSDCTRCSIKKKCCGKASLKL